MAITKEQKTEILQDLLDKFAKSKSVIFADYRGIDVSSISNLRNKLRENDAETKVAKKTLIKLAAKDKISEEISDEILSGPITATFSYGDEMAGLKVLFDFSKENDKLKLMGGIIDGRLVGTEEIIKLAKLPSRDELLAKLLASLNSPVTGFVATLSNVMSGFVRVVDAYKNTIPAEDAPAPKVEVAVENPVEEVDAPKEEVKTESAEETPAE